MIAAGIALAKASRLQDEIERLDHRIDSTQTRSGEAFDRLYVKHLPHVRARIDELVTLVAGILGYQTSRSNRNSYGWVSFVRTAPAAEYVRVDAEKQEGK